MYARVLRGVKRANNLVLFSQKRLFIFANIFSILELIRSIFFFNFESAFWTVFLISFSTFLTFSSTSATSTFSFSLALPTFSPITCQSRLPQSPSEARQVVQSPSGEEYLTPSWRHS